METTYMKLPVYVKIACILFIIAIIFLILYIGHSIIVPLLMSLIFAILLRPVVIFFNKKVKLPHVIAVLITVFIFILIILAIIFFISWQVSEITDDWASIKKNFNLHYKEVQKWIYKHFRFTYYEQQTYVKGVTKKVMDGDSALVGKTINSLSDFIFNALLMPIYTFLILLYRNLFKKFLYKIVKASNEIVLTSILKHIKTVIHSYIVGLAIQFCFVGVLTTGGLMILGVQYAILLGTITAVFNLIPYIGILLATIITLFATLVSSNEISVMIGVLILTVIVQFIDNNILVPRVVGNKVQINAMASIVGVIVGGTLAGIAGMFLAIPLIAILKVIFDRIESLSPIGFLMGDDLMKTYNWRKIKLPDFNQGDTNNPDSNDQSGVEL